MRARLFVPNTRFNLDLSDHGSATPGTHVVVWSKWHPGKNQTWRFEEGEFSPHASYFYLSLAGMWGRVLCIVC